MSTLTLQQSGNSRWMKWNPKARILADSPDMEATKPTKPTSILGDPPDIEPSKPTKPGFEGFVGATLPESPKIEACLDPAELTRASGVLSRAGVRLMELDSITTVGIWSDLDGPEVRAALRVFESDRLPVRYLDGSGIPMHFKLRRVEGEPVPMNMLAEMERQPAEPWNVRDRMLLEMGWCSKRVACRRTGRRRL